MNEAGALVVADVWLSRWVGDDRVEAAFTDAVGRAGMTVVGTVRHAFTPHGLTSILLLAESHAAIHTYPERRYVSVDVYTCGPNGAPEAAVRAMMSALPVERATVRTISRGEDAP